MSPSDRRFVQIADALRETNAWTNNEWLCRPDLVSAEKLLLGDPFTGAQAVECGLATAVLPAGEVVNHARRVAERFNALPPGAVRESKRLLREPHRAEILKTIATEGQLFAARLRSPEGMEAFQAFFQKRQPDYSKFS